MYILSLSYYYFDFDFVMALFGRMKKKKKKKIFRKKKKCVYVVYARDLHCINFQIFIQTTYQNSLFIFIVKL